MAVKNKLFAFGSNWERDLAPFDRSLQLRFRATESEWRQRFDTREDTVITLPGGRNIDPRSEDARPFLRELTEAESRLDLKERRQLGGGYLFREGLIKSFSSRKYLLDSKL